MNVGAKMNKLSGAERLLVSRRARHPWYVEYERLAKEWDAKVRAVAEQGFDPATYWGPRTHPSVEQSLRYIRLILSMPDMRELWEEQVRREIEEGLTTAMPDLLDVHGSFQDWMFLREDEIPIVPSLIESLYILREILKGKIEGPDAPEVKQHLINSEWVLGE